MLTAQLQINKSYNITLSETLPSIGLGLSGAKVESIVGFMDAAKGQDVYSIYNEFVTKNNIDIYDSIFYKIEISPNVYVYILHDIISTATIAYTTMTLKMMDMDDTKLYKLNILLKDHGFNYLIE